MQECRSAGVQEFRSTGVQEYRSTGVQEYRSAGVQEYWNTGVQEHPTGKRVKILEETRAHWTSLFQTSTPRGRAREDLRRNWRSVASHGKNVLYGCASEVKAEITLMRGVRAL